MILDRFSSFFDARWIHLRRSMQNLARTTCDAMSQRTNQFVCDAVLRLPENHAFRQTTQRFVTLGGMLMQRTVNTVKNQDPVARDLAALIDVGQRCYERGWLYGTAGNLSVRSAAHSAVIHITASGLDKGALTYRDFLRITLDEAASLPATQRQSPALQPSAETAIHKALYLRYPKVGCVLHVHTVPALLIADLHGEEGAFVFSGLEVQKGLGGASQGVNTRVPIVNNETDMGILANQINSTLRDDTCAVLIRHHGIYVWGPTVATTNQYLELLHHVFEYTIETHRVMKRN